MAMQSARIPDPWCPQGVLKCPCIGAQKYPMASWRGPEAATTFNLTTRAFAAYPPSRPWARQCSTQDFEQPRNTCFPHAASTWAPGQWAYRKDGFRPTLPEGVSASLMERACDGLVVHTARPQWVPLIQKLYALKYAPPTWTVTPIGGAGNQSAERRAQKARCLSQLSGFRPKVCSLRNVLVWGHAKRMMAANGSMYYLPPEVVAEQRAHDMACPDNCRARSTNVVACGGHAVIGRNLMGVQFYHTLCAHHALRGAPFDVRG